MWNEHLGYVLTCPSNLGTGLRGGVHLKIPKLAEHPKFAEVSVEIFFDCCRPTTFLLLFYFCCCTILLKNSFIACSKNDIKKRASPSKLVIVLRNRRSLLNGYLMSVNVSVKHIHRLCLHL